MSIVGEERKNIILEQINTKGKIKVEEIAMQLKVSTETTRKYLSELEQQGKLKRVHGGAVKSFLEKQELPFSLREIENISEKQGIALEASKLIEDNDIIALDEGSTTYKVIEYITGKKNLTILTCSLPILSVLCDLAVKGIFDGKIIFIGGVVNAKHLRVSGGISEEMLDLIYVNKAFISTEGVSLEGGVTSYDCDKAMLSRKLVNNAKYKYVLCDHTKLDVRTSYKICDLKALTGIICDSAPEKKWIDTLKQNDILWLSPSK
ncbi:DeoR/GlpR transcriptional regulator [Fusibacter paucivorans]|uniref:DeoR/GlpR transcriptional regulator n=1 Tax=Fusibacter paucivorans TaxID=76009 RepID=A0ABS5PQQ3_9FIRM|nr:DeoR/GlpR family DNA-binding transcription regulator [Fusibacter paucivorans]MBS7526936.1 DeoR/GlpR transcriptional regulator [Fusibacter paucivorans]